MTDGQKIMLIAVGVVLILGMIVGGALNHHIGGFLETVAREEEEEARAREARESEKSENTGE